MASTYALGAESHCSTVPRSSRAEVDGRVFFDAIDQSAIDQKEDLKYGMRRVELLCHHCQGHLGHIFTDGPPPHGLRYCMNSVSLDFSARQSLTKEPKLKKAKD